MTVPHTIPELCRFQAGWCGKLGSPLYEHLLNCCATDYEQGGPLLDLLETHEPDPQGSALALRMMGAVHRLVLEGRVPQLCSLLSFHRWQHCVRWRLESLSRDCAGADAGTAATEPEAGADQ